jgi:hypothetical protein
LVLLSAAIVIASITLVVVSRGHNDNARLAASSDTRVATTPDASTTTTVRAIAVVATTATPPSTTEPAPTTTDPPAPWILSGRAVDANGAPISGVYVYDFGPASGMGYGPAVARSDIDGTYTIPCPSGPVLLYGGGPTFASVQSPDLNWQPAFVGGGESLSSATTPACQAPGSEPEMVTVMYPGGLITGTIYDSAGNPVVGTGSGGYDVNASLPGLWDDVSELSGQPDANGRYWFVGLPPGDYVLDSGMRAHLGLRHTVHVEVGKTEIVDWWSTDDPRNTTTTTAPD